jgi:DNA-directed RNA polymerase specialized sigma24 family protein
MEYTNSQMKSIIEEWVHSIRDREILFDRYINGLSFEVLAEKHDLSVRHVKTIVYKYEQVIFSHLPG